MTGIERSARRVLEAMRSATPKGAAKPWKTAKNIAHVAAALGDGIPLEDLLELVVEAGAYVEAHPDQRVFWHPENLFAKSGPDKWAARVADWRAAQAEVEERRSAIRAVVEPPPRPADDGSDPLANVISPEFRSVAERARRALLESQGGPVQIGLPGMDGTT